MKRNLGVSVMLLLLLVSGCVNSEEQTTTAVDEVELELVQLCPQDAICQYCLEYSKSDGTTTTFGAANVSSIQQARELLRKAGVRRGRLNAGTCADQSTACTMDYRPVCDSETNSTFGNECALKVAVRQQAGDDGKARTTYTNGACDQTVVCLYDGETYEAGESFKVDCNTCVCGDNGLLRCTLMACH